MAILTERKTWTKPRAPTYRRRSTDLTYEEQAHLVAALRVLARMHGSITKMEAAVGVTKGIARKAINGTCRPTAGLAVRVARVVGTSVGELLVGAWPAAGCCRRCGWRLGNG